MATVAQVLAYWKSRHDTEQHPRWRQLLEMAMLYVLRGIGPGYYVQARWGASRFHSPTSGIT